MGMSQASLAMSAACVRASGRSAGGGAQRSDSFVTYTVASYPDNIKSREYCIPQYFMIIRPILV
jgi:hypothetical protein